MGSDWTYKKTDSFTLTPPHPGDFLESQDHIATGILQGCKSNLNFWNDNTIESLFYLYKTQSVRRKKQDHYATKTQTSPNWWELRLTGKELKSSS